MFRKTILAIAATAALAGAALAPTSASAWYGQGGWGHHHGFYRGIGVGFYAPGYAYGGCYMKKRWVDTAYGTRLRWVRVCY